jgi:hypothetical protein
MKKSTDGNTGYCDNCQKPVLFKKGFPYHEKWIYLYVISLKTAENTYLGKRDKGFCSPSCCGNYMQKLAEGKLENSKSKSVPSVPNKNEVALQGATTDSSMIKPAIAVKPATVKPKKASIIPTNPDAPHILVKQDVPKQKSLKKTKKL